jgi:hypothetical protein
MSKSLDHYLCFNCGFITPVEKWTYWIWDDKGNEKIAVPEGWHIFARCPVCQWDHTDDDSNPGYLDGLISVLCVERQEALEDWGDRWKEVEEEVFGL